MEGSWVVGNVAHTETAGRYKKSKSHPRLWLLVWLCGLSFSHRHISTVIAYVTPWCCESCNLARCLIPKPNKCWCHVFEPPEMWAEEVHFFFLNIVSRFDYFAKATENKLISLGKNET